MNREKRALRMTRYSTGSGCGCKLSPATLETILSGSLCLPDEDRLIVGNSSRDDAAVYDLGNGEYLIFTTDFFTPIVDDAFDFGYIAAVNAINDVYAMGGRPIMALGILAWPIDRLSAEQARPVVDGARTACENAGIPMAGGHSIENPEPVFGLAVNGLVQPSSLKTNGGARSGDKIYLTKSLGTGLLATAEKRDLLRDEDRGLAAAEMKKLNSIGSLLASMPGVHCLTDVTGFGLLGHMLEVCDESNVSVRIDYSSIKQLTDLSYYVEAGSIAGGLRRNWESYGSRVTKLEDPVRSILCDPQTAGGLLVVVDPGSAPGVEELLRDNGLDKHIEPIATVMDRNQAEPVIQVTGHERVQSVSAGARAVLTRSGSTIEPMHRSPVFPDVRGDCAPPNPADGSPGEMIRMMKGMFADLWKYRRELKKQGWIKKFARKNGYRVNPHPMFLLNLRLWLVEAEKSFGKRYCPCFEPSDDEQINRRMICPCEFIEADIESKGTCHCTLFGASDLTDEGFREAEARLMREYRVDLRFVDHKLDTTDIPLDPYRGLKVPDSFHLTKRAIMLHGVPLQVFTEKEFEANNIQSWAATKGISTTISPASTPFRDEDGGGYVIDLFSWRSMPEDSFDRR